MFLLVMSDMFGKHCFIMSPLSCQNYRQSPTLSRLRCGLLFGISSSLAAVHLLSSPPPCTGTVVCSLCREEEQTSAT